ncbi:MAG TPA: nuclear transport factor 2 family protein [Solirubrobacteraceae bacterium]|nr:nuclear transport factor 2 family protein [Solirubrobacteraceae bacterium]
MTAASHRNQKQLSAPAEAEARLDGVVAAHNSHDPAAFVAHFMPDGVVRIVPTGDTVQGHEQITAFLEGNLRAFPDWQLERRGLYHCADGIWVEWTITGTHADEFMGHPATRRGIELLGCSRFTFTTGGLIAEEALYVAPSTILHQLGLLSERGVIEPAIGDATADSPTANALTALPGGRQPKGRNR